METNCINHVIVNSDLIGVNELRRSQAHLSNSYYVPFAVLRALYSLYHFKVDENMRYSVLLFPLRYLRTKSLAAFRGRRRRKKFYRLRSS